MKQYFILFILLNFSLNAQNKNNIIITYKYIRLPDTLKSDDINKKNAVKLIKQAADYAKSYRYVLKVNKNESFYSVDYGIRPDDIQNPLAYDISKFIAFGSGSFYQNKFTKQVINYKKTLGKFYAVTDSLNKDWHITNETKYIGKYKVFKAYLYCESCKQNITAWFAPELPLPFGPSGFGGLPGLILELKKYKNILKFESIKFTEKKLKFELLKEAIPITKEKLESLQWKKRAEMMRRRRN